MTSQQDFFSSLRSNQQTYLPSDTIRQELAKKTLIMVVGPSAIGKSTTMNTVVAKDDRFQRVSGFTSRAARPNDEPGMYRYVTEDHYQQLQERIADRQLVQYAVSPVKDVVYGTEIGDYPGQYNLQDTWSSAVDNYRKLGFGEYKVVGLVADPLDWKKWFQTRFPQDDQAEALSRLTEAHQSLSWLLTQHANSVYWVKNRELAHDHAADALINVIDLNTSDIGGPNIAAEMIDVISSLRQKYGAA
ncbi:hypothetical protein EON76_06230 [bacterium]|nr:MAG: hypothetical protein EON76_06230 [bacterium]